MYIPYPDEILKKLQQEELEVLKAFANLCKRHDIKWFATGGTLLGTVRHQGFIPWDDDIDVLMPKKEYEKFIKIPREEYDAEWGFISPETGNGYYNFIPKFYKKNSKFVTSITKRGKGKQIGIFIEIFPYTYVSDNPKVRAKHYRYLKILFAMLFETSLPRTINKHGIRMLARLLFRCMGITAEKVNRQYVKWYNQAISQEPTNTMGQYCYSPDSEAYLFSPENIFPLREMAFEDMNIIVPNQPEKILKGYYGDDYMELPPPEKRWNQSPAYIKFSDGTEYDFTK